MEFLDSGFDGIGNSGDMKVGVVGEIGDRPVRVKDIAEYLGL